MSDDRVQIELDGAVARIWLNRPDVHNAFDADLIANLTSAVRDLGSRNEIRVVVLSGRGKSFSAGGDIEWMKRQGTATVEENTADARKLAQLFHTIDTCPKPTVARVNGAALGGGVGLVATCDIAIGSASAQFATSEVRLGLVPATIAPYVVRAIGERHARRLFQSAERIDAAAAQRIGLLHEVVAPEELDLRIAKLIGELLAGAPHAQKASKELAQTMAHASIHDDLLEQTAKMIAERRSLPEAREGLSAFLAKRSASWVPQS